MENFISLAYIVAIILFILGLKGLTHPRTAVRGNLLGAMAMLIAIVVTLIHKDLMGYPLGYILIGFGLVVGAVIGAVLAIRIQMTAMPQMVALFNGFGGAASVLVAWAELCGEKPTEMGIETSIVAAMLAGLIGAVTFWGSLVAFAKLQEIKSFKNPFDYPLQKLGNAVLAVIVVLLVIMGIWTGGHPAIYILLILAASVLGVTLVNPIGGADMPVVIALLNSYSGLAATATGFVLDNSVLIVAGSLVGASGLILTSIMCKAMNRSLTNVLFGVMGDAGEAASADDVYGGKVKSTTADEVAMLFETARRVVIVPGYGMAVAQAQHAVRDLMGVLEDRGIEVEFAVHPVAGRMPGHMNVLLAEAEVPYEQLKELEEINPAMSQTDVVLVIGANDVVNPEAHNPQSAIAGMPIVDCAKARTCIVIKRSLSPGFAGIPNPLFAMDKTLMFFGDGKRAILDLVSALKE